MKNLSNKIKIILFGLFLIISEMSYGQLSIKKSTVDSGGAITESSGLKVVFNIGEVAVTENSSGNLSISEGFISPNIFNTVGVSDFRVLEGVNLFPNPTSGILNVNFSNESNYTIEIYTMNGKQLYVRNFESQLNNSVDFQNYPSSIYVVIIKDNTNKTFKSYKLIKD